MPRYSPSRAQEQIINAGYVDVDIYIDAKKITNTDALISFAQNGGLSKIPNEGYVSNIYIRTAYGWIHIDCNHISFFEWSD